MNRRIDPLDLVDPRALELTPEEELRLIAADPPKSCWWSAPAGTPAPEPGVRDGLFTGPWLHPWSQLNDPAEDAMVGMMMMGRYRSMPTFLHFGLPTQEMRQEWEETFETGQPLTLAAHTTPEDRRLFVWRAHAIRTEAFHHGLTYVVVEGDGLPVYECQTPSERIPEEVTTWMPF